MGARLVVEGEAEHATWLGQHAHDAALAELNSAPAPADTTAATVPASAGAH